MSTSKTIFNVHASSTPGWHEVNWKFVHKKVRQLQVRIVKATKAGRWRDVERLQHLLTHSFAAKLLAVKRVTENQGKNTAGIDGELWSTPEKKFKASLSLSKSAYQPKPARRVYLDNGQGKRRPIGIQTMKDRAMQALYHLALDPVAEVTADPNSYGFRQARSAHDAIEQVHLDLAGQHKAQWILRLDIKSCFDQLHHGWLEAHIPMDKTLLRKWMKAGYVEDGFRYATQEGLPQGGCISPCITNLALDDLEQQLRQNFVKKRGYRGNPNKLNYVRFADDILITGASYDFLANDVMPLVKAFLVTRGLSLNEQKSQIVHRDEGFEFLGFNIRRYDKKTLCKPSKHAIKNFKRKINQRLSNMQAVRAVDVIRHLNPIILGWGHYYQHGVSKKTFQSLDNWLWQKLWAWAKRRHPRKSHYWIVAKYFEVSTGWRFYADADGRRLHLFKLAKLAIKRHIKVKAQANPYDPEWELYFEARQAKQWLAHPARSQRLKKLYEKQAGQCPSCQQLITQTTGWNLHHVIPRYLGGDDTLSNLRLLHPNCHRQLHALDSQINLPECPPDTLIIA